MIIVATSQVGMSETVVAPIGKSVLSRLFRDDLSPLLRHDPETGKGHRIIINNIESTTRRLWYEMFDPASSELQRLDNYLVINRIFRAFTRNSISEMKRAWCSDSDLNLLSRKGRDPDEAFSEITSRIPDGEHFVIPVMLSGIWYASLVSQYLEDRSRYLGSAFVGYSTGFYKQHRFRDKTDYCGRVHINEWDYYKIRKNLDKSILVVDDSIATGQTMRSIKGLLQSIGAIDVKDLVIIDSNK